MREYQQKNNDKLREYRREYQQKNKDKIAGYRQEWYQQNKDKIADYKREYHQQNKDKIADWHREYRQDNKDKHNERQREYRQDNKDKFAAYKRKYRQDNPQAMIVMNLRTRLNVVLKGGKKSAPTMELVGCTTKELMQHLESQFTEGMTFKNYGEWHIDHIVPCAAFDLTDPEQQRLCFHYSNLQPLWATDNLSKWTKLPHEISGRAASEKG